MRKIILTTVIIAVMILISKFSFAPNKNADGAQDIKFSYAYISVEGKLFSKKLKVRVDFGDTPEQINKGNEYSEYLTNKKSYVAVLNYMVENQFELVNTLELTESSQGSGGTSGIVFIMKKKE
jgi:hypothetical protein